jgi:hypothetical protein
MNHYLATIEKKDFIKGILGILRITLKVVIKEAFPDINFAISSPFMLLAKLENIFGAISGNLFRTSIKILSKNKSIFL